VVRDVTSARTQLAGKQANGRQARPLSQPKRLDELPLRVLEGKGDRIDSGNGQGLTACVQQQGTASWRAKQTNSVAAIRIAGLPPDRASRRALRVRAR
jgi:hypothetical protein